MSRHTAARLTEIGHALLVAAGAPEEEAAIVMRHCIEANLAGHDSHGIIQIPTYIDRIGAGHIVPGAPWTIVQESPTTTVVDGNWGFGYVANERAMKLTIEKARTANVAAATVFRQGHIGRLATYPLMAAREGMIGLITADSGRAPKHVAPFGGREERLGTNPISIAVPSDLDGPLFLDMATSGVAAGKVALAAARGQEIPEGWSLLQWINSEVARRFSGRITIAEDLQNNRWLTKDVGAGGAGFSLRTARETLSGSDLQDDDRDGRPSSTAF